ncbi:MAG: hypothetical protein LQ342_004477 [Letrouitia transgressa]|nr:MAG: hypothetical protein LQ342_004477 [Letrouitia transgressa]
MMHMIAHLKTRHLMASTVRLAYEKTPEGSAFRKWAVDQILFEIHCGSLISEGQEVDAWVDLMNEVEDLPGDFIRRRLCNHFPRNIRDPFEEGWLYMEVLSYNDEREKLKHETVPIDPWDQLECFDQNGEWRRPWNEFLLGEAPSEEEAPEEW